MHHDYDYRLIEDTLFVIVIYNCVITQSIAFQSLRKADALSHPKDVFIYDNSLSPQAVPSGNERIHYHHNPLNAGVSAAYNEGSRKAKQFHKKWLLLMDQDTDFPGNAWNKYEQGILNYPDKRVFVPTLIDGHQIVSPFRLRWGKGIKIDNRQPGVHSFRHLCVINSGLLISSELFEAAGGYDERFPLDFSDVIFIERLSAITPEFIWINATCIHSLSSQQDKNATTSVVLNRFKKYSAAAALLKKISRKKTLLSFILLPRAFKLGLMKKDFRFLSTALNALMARS